MNDSRNHVQIIDNDCVHRYAKDKYPDLHSEVMSHDRVSRSSWYDLSDVAFDQYKAHFEEMKQRGIFREDAKIKQ